MVSTIRSGSTVVPVRKVGPEGVVVTQDDSVAAEEPLAIRLAWQSGNAQTVHDIAVTMRTPVNDFDLALGFLFTEGLIRSIDEVSGIDWEASTAADSHSNVLVVGLHAAPEVDVSRLQRNFFVSSSCGICGKASIEAISAQAAYPVRGDQLQVGVKVLNRLPGQLVAGQSIFAGTGSIHAAALFDAEGLTGEVYEDVGRHNALDKLIGANLRAGRMPLWNQGVILSGRTSFELVQKARMAGCAMLVAVGAPSSLAVELAWESDMSLIGFLRDGRFNVYAGPARIKAAD